MNLLTTDLSSKALDKDLRKVISRVECYEMSQHKANLCLSNGRIEQALDYFEEQRRCLEEIKQFTQTKVEHDRLAKVAWDLFRSGIQIVEVYKK